jgi:hypothetical protein
MSAVEGMAKSDGTGMPSITLLNPVNRHLYFLGFLDN